MAAAIRVLDPHTGPNGAGQVAGPGVPKVLIENLPAAVFGTPCAYPTGLVDTVNGGSSTVLVGDRQLARAGDQTALGNVLGPGAPTVETG